MATGGFKPNATTDFLEEWKAKREKMRAKMLGDIAAATGAPMGASNTNSTNRHAAAAAAAPPPGTELANNPERSVPTGNCLPSSYSVARSSSGSALKRPEEETHHHPASPTSNLKKTPPQPEKAPCASPDSSSPMACNDSDKESPSPSKAKEKNSSGPSARKGKGQIEKRKLREKRRSTGVVSIPSNEVSQLFFCDLKCKKKKKSPAGKNSSYCGCHLHRESQRSGTQQVSQQDSGVVYAVWAMLCSRRLSKLSQTPCDKCLFLIFCLLFGCMKS